MSHRQTTTDKAEPQLDEREPCQIIRPIDNALLQAETKPREDDHDNDTDPPLAA